MPSLRPPSVPFSDPAASMPGARCQESALSFVREAAATAKARGAPLRLAVVLPSSASGVVSLGDALWMPAIATHRLLTTPPPVKVAPRGGVGWWMVGVMAAALTGLAVVVATQAPSTVIVRTQVPATILASTQDVPDTRDPVVTPAATPREAVPAPQPEVESAPQRVATAEAAQDPDPDPPGLAVDKVPAQNYRRPRAPVPIPQAEATPEPVMPAARAPKATPASTMPSVECVLDPSRCAPHSAPPVDRPDPSSSAPGKLPSKLSAAQLRDGLQAIKPGARQCGREYGVPAGTGIKLKLSLVGAVGEIDSATVVDPQYAGTPLASCLEAAIKKARFPKFATARVGALYTVRL